MARDALEIWSQTAVPEDTRTGKAHWVLGVVSDHHGKQEVAISHLENALRLLLLGHGKDHPWVKEVREALERLQN